MSDIKRRKLYLDPSSAVTEVPKRTLRQRHQNRCKIGNLEQLGAVVVSHSNREGLDCNRENSGNGDDLNKRNDDEDPELVDDGDDPDDDDEDPELVGDGDDADDDDEDPELVDDGDDPDDDDEDPELVDDGDDPDDDDDDAGDDDGDDPDDDDDDAGDDDGDDPDDDSDNDRSSHDDSDEERDANNGVDSDNSEDEGGVMFDDLDLRTPINEAGTTKGHIILLLLAFVLRHSLSDKAMIDLIILINTILDREVVSPSKYLMDKLFRNTFKHATVHFFCNVCKNVLKSVKGMLSVINETVLCQQCQQRRPVSFKENNFFAILNLLPQIKKFLERPFINKQIIADAMNRIGDVYDSFIYKSMTQEGGVLSGGVNLTYNFNTDGAAVFKSSKNTMWPIQLSINELPPKTRHNNPILAGIWFGRHEPVMKLFLEKFVEQGKKLLTIGVTWQKGVDIITSKMFPFCCAVDSIARPLLQTSTQFNGYFGCSFCYHPGKIVNRVIKYAVDVPPYRDRCDEEVRVDMQLAEARATKVRGIKSKSPLFEFQSFDLTWGFSVDYMHAVLQGVTRQLMDIWTGTPQKPYYIGGPRQRAIIEGRLSSIRPPQMIHRTPRSLKDRANWKATEWRMWLLHYCLPCLVGVLQVKYLEHLALLSEAVYLLLQTNISAQDIIDAETKLCNFVCGMQLLYGDAAMTFNVHLMTHIAKSVKMCGPLWATSAFCFESGIHKYQKFIKGPKGVLKQIVKKALMTDSLIYLKEQTVLNERGIHLYNDLTGVITQGERITPLGKGNPVMEEDNIDHHIDLHGYTSKWKFTRLRVNGHTFCIKDYTRTEKSNDSYITTRDGRFGQILHILELKRGEETIYNVVISLFDIQPAVFGQSQLTYMHKYEDSLETVVIDPIDIANAVLVEINPRAMYISKFPNDLENK